MDQGFSRLAHLGFCVSPRGPQDRTWGESCSPYSTASSLPPKGRGHGSLPWTVAPASSPVQSPTPRQPETRSLLSTTQRACPSSQTPPGLLPQAPSLPAHPALPEAGARPVPRQRPLHHSRPLPPLVALPGRSPAPVSAGEPLLPPSWLPVPWTVPPSSVSPALGA